MKILVIIVRVLLGLMFVVFGLNGFLNFIPMKGPMPEGLAGDFMRALLASHYMDVVAALQVLGGALCLLGGRFVPLGLLVLGPVIVNILLFHILLMPKNVAPGIVAAVFSLFLLWAYRHAFACLMPGNVLASRPAAANTGPTSAPAK